MLVLITGHPLALGCVLWYVRLFLGATCSQSTDLIKDNKQSILNTTLWTAYLDKIIYQKSPHKSNSVPKNQWEEGDGAPSKGSYIPSTPCGC